MVIWDIFVKLPPHGWREISNTEAVMAWLASVTDEDEIFLEVLLQLRYVGIRTDTGRYQGLLLSNVGEFFGGKEYIIEGPDKIEEEEHLMELVSQVRKAIKPGSPDIPL